MSTPGFTARVEAMMRETGWSWSKCCSELGKRGAKARSRKSKLVRKEVRTQEARGIR